LVCAAAFGAATIKAAMEAAAVKAAVKVCFDPN
jgi:hypothetical protein